MLDHQELALQAVEERYSGHPEVFNRIALALQEDVGAGRTKRLIERAERDLAQCNCAATTPSAGE